MQYYEDQDQTHNRDGDNRINNGQDDEADERWRLELHEASEPSLGEGVVAKGNKFVISSMANPSIRLQIGVLGKPVTGVDMVPAFSPYLISFGSNSPRLAATSDVLAIELYDAC